MEYFKDIPGYEGFYKASNYGRILALPRQVKNRYSFKITEYCFLKPMTVKGYQKTRLYKNGKGKTVSFHRCVISAFRGVSDLEVNHIDGNKSNNTLANLEYVTRQENMNHAAQNNLLKNLVGESHSQSKLKEKEVLEIFKSNESDSRLAKKYNCSRAAIWRIKNGKNWSWLTGGIKSDLL